MGPSPSASIEAKILIDFKLALRASRRLLLTDLFEVCGEQETYTLKDAKRLHKQQWKANEYASALDLNIGGEPRISQARILQLRAQYIAERGATLNNPHITKAHLDKFTTTDRAMGGPRWSDGIRQITTAFVRSHPNHPALLPGSDAIGPGSGKA